MGILSYGYKAAKSLGQTINKVKTNVPKTEIQKKIRDLKISTQKAKAGKAKLDQTIFELKNNKPFTFKKNTKKSESNTESYKRITEENNKVIKNMLDKATENKKDGGRMGYKDGTKGGRKMGGGSNMSNTAVKKKFKNLANLPETIQIKIAGKKIAKKV
tara:strand:+ start:44 stop:520 length:477 start_codon:yes stop_codon:yes gene_type:complete